MERRLTLTENGDKTESLKPTSTSMRSIILLGITTNGDKLTPLVDFEGKSE
jgi:hypothetical protein